MGFGQSGIQWRPDLAAGAFLCAIPIPFIRQKALELREQEGAETSFAPVSGLEMGGARLACRQQLVPQCGRETG